MIFSSNGSKEPVCSEQVGCLLIATIGQRAKLTGVIHDDEGYLLLSDLVVVADYRNRGFGTLRLKEAEQFAIERRLSSLRGNLCKADLDSNSALSGFYKKRGFEITESIAPPFVAGIVKRLDLLETSC